MIQGFLKVTLKEIFKITGKDKTLKKQGVIINTKTQTQKKEKSIKETRKDKDEGRKTPIETEGYLYNTRARDKRGAILYFALDNFKIIRSKGNKGYTLNFHKLFKELGIEKKDRKTGAVETPKLVDKRIKGLLEKFFSKLATKNKNYTPIRVSGVSPIDKFYSEITVVSVKSKATAK